MHYREKHMRVQKNNRTLKGKGNIYKVSLGHIQKELYDKVGKSFLIHEPQPGNS